MKRLQNSFRGSLEVSQNAIRYSHGCQDLKNDGNTSRDVSGVTGSGNLMSACPRVVFLPEVHSYHETFPIRFTSMTPMRLAQRILEVASVFAL